MQRPNENRQKPARASWRSSKAIGNETIRRERYLRKTIEGTLAGIAEAGRGGRNLALNGGAGLLRREEAEALLLGTALSAGLDKIETTATIKSGLDAGEKRLRSLPARGSLAPIKLDASVWVTVPPVEDLEREARALWRMRNLCCEALPATGTAAEAYLRSRGIACLLPGNIRFLPRHWHRESGQHWPVCLFPIQPQPGAEVIAMHRVFLRAEGSGKAPVKPIKKALRKFRGGGIWFGEAGDTLVIVEGLEDALSCHMAGYFTVSAVGCGNMANLIIPHSVNCIIIGADHGDAGERAADKAAQTYMRQGGDVSVAFPPVGEDWNSLLQRSDREVAA